MNTILSLFYCHFILVIQIQFRFLLNNHDDIHDKITQLTLFIRIHIHKYTYSCACIPQIWHYCFLTPLYAYHCFHWYWTCLSVWRGRCVLVSRDRDRDRVVQDLLRTKQGKNWGMAAKTALFAHDGCSLFRVVKVLFQTSAPTRYRDRTLSAGEHFAVWVTFRRRC